MDMTLSGALSLKLCYTNFFSSHQYKACLRFTSIVNLDRSMGIISDLPEDIKVSKTVLICLAVHLIRKKNTINDF